MVTIDLIMGPWVFDRPDLSFSSVVPFSFVIYLKFIELDFHTFDFSWTGFGLVVTLSSVVLSLATSDIFNSDLSLSGFGRALSTISFG